MKYDVAYVSQSGNTKALARAAARMLPGRARLTDLKEEELPRDGDIYLMGYGVNRGAVPVEIMDALEQVEGKTVGFFVTCGLEPTDAYRAAIERKVLPFLPDQCAYKGMFLCAGQFPPQLVQSARECLSRDPENAQAKALLTQHQKTQGHPNEEDHQRLERFLSALAGCGDKEDL